MKIKTLIFCLSILVPSLTFAQKLNQRATDSKNQKEILIGNCDRAGLESAPFGEWFQKEYSDYKPDTQTLDLIRKQMKRVKIVLVMATWCSDSRREVPRFYKILDYQKIKSKKMKVICVDRNKKAGDLPISDLKATYVPTFIIYKKNKELGRIIESPAETLEKDLLKFLSAK
jgi:thiol-disulfide isomerase/thioredoxin